MINWRKYALRYLRAFVTGKYLLTLGPGITFLVLFFLPVERLLSAYPQIQQISSLPYRNPWTLALGLLLALWTALRFGYDILNEELQRLDAENQVRSPRTRLERAYYLMHQLIIEGETLIPGRAHLDRIREWDERVQLTLGRWCQPGGLEVYLGNSRPFGQDQLQNPQAALDALKYVLRVLDRFIQ